MKDRIYQLRKHFHLTQVEMGKSIGTSISFIGLVETGRSGMSDETVEKICEKFHVSAAWLRDGSGPMLNEDPASWVVRGEKKNREAITARIKEARKSLHLSQKAFAERMNYSRVAIALVEQGRNNASDVMLRKIEETYGIRIGGDEGKFSPVSHIVNTCHEYTS